MLDSLGVDIVQGVNKTIIALPESHTNTAIHMSFSHMFKEASQIEVCTRI